MTVHWRVRAAQAYLLLQVTVIIQVSHIMWTFFHQNSLFVFMMTVTLPAVTHLSPGDKCRFIARE